jgi:hypothetical protein
MDLKLYPRDKFNKIAYVCSILTAGLGMIAMVGWVLNWRILSSIRLQYIPMAPNTALLFILTGGVLFIRPVWSMNKFIYKSALLFVLLSIVIASISLFEFLTGIDFGINNLLFHTTETLGAVPIGHMSPITAFNFILVSVALLLLMRQVKKIAAILGSVVVVIGGIVLIGYWYGAPLLYGGHIIPIALPTALAFVVLGIGLVTAAGPEVLPLKALTGPSTGSRLLRVFLPVMLAIIFINDWIDIIISGQTSSKVVLASAVTAILSLVMIYIIISLVARTVGNMIDRTETERKQAVATLRDSEARFRAIASNTPDHILMQDRDLRYTFVANPQLGLTEADMLGSA